MVPTKGRIQAPRIEADSPVLIRWTRASATKHVVYSRGLTNDSKPEHENMTDPEWQTRLAQNFTTTGLIGGNLADIDRYELEAGNWVVERFGGHLVLLDSFMGFFLDTLDLAQGWMM
jgi:hypothetical protein